MKSQLSKLMTITLVTTACVLMLGGLVQASPARQPTPITPSFVSYQGQVWDGDTPYDGTGYFKFAIVNTSGSTSYWSNDGTSTSGNEPTASVSLSVSDGLFSVLLGDTSLGGGMTEPLTADAFDDPNTLLRVWFSETTSGFTQMPDMKIAAVPYALVAEMAASAGDADTLDGKHASAFQLRVTTICPANYAMQEISASGTPVCVPVEARPGYSLTIVPDSQYYGISPSIAIGVDGLPLISFFGGASESDGGLYVMHCNTLDCTDYEISKIDTGTSDFVGAQSSLVIGEDGLGLIAYLDGENNNVMIAHCADIACSYADDINTIVYGGSFYIYDISAAIGVDGYPLIVSIIGHPTTIDFVYMTHCNDLRCSSYTGASITSATNILNEASLAIGSDGLGLVAYHDETSGDLMVGHCNTVVCATGGSTHVAIDTSADVGVVNAITIGADGLGLIAYYSETDGALKVAHCDNVTCSSATSVVLDDDATSILGSWPSITLGADGLGLIVYDAYVGTNAVIKIAHCSNVTCSSAITYTIDNLGDTSYAGQPSVTIGTDGMPIIAYYNPLTTDLKVMHCSNTFCLPYVRRH